MKLNNLQILRGISALLVCCFHFRDDLNFGHLKLGEFLFSKGGIGVPIFFVISGFIMVFTTQKINFKTGNISNQIISFYKKRIIRIIPLYYLLTIAWIIVGGNILLYLSEESLQRLVYSLLFLPQKDTFPVLFLGWSLNYEMFFYLVFGISLIFTTRRYIFIIALFITIYILGLIFNFENAFLQMVTSSLNLHFVAGILFGIILTKKNIDSKYTVFLSTAGILFFALMFFKVIIIKSQLLSLLIVSLFVLSFLLFDYSFKWKGNKALIFLGDISYSLYLSHPFVEILFKRLKIQNDIFKVPFFLIKIAAAIAVASFLYYFIEKKVTDYLKIKLNT